MPAIPDGNGGAEIKLCSRHFAFRTPHLLKPVGGIRVGALVGLGVAINWESVMTVLAECVKDAFLLPQGRPHTDQKIALPADGTGERMNALFYGLVNLHAGH